MTETFAYDKKTGNLLSHTDFNGKTTTFSYDPNTDLLLSTTYADGSIESFTYDVSGNRLLMKAENGTTSYSYDNFHRLIKEVKPNQAVLEYGYDKRSNRTRLKFTEPSGTAAQVQYQYDVLSRLKKVIAPDGETVYQYDSVGNRQQVIYPNGTKTRYAYDKLNRLTSLETRKPDNGLLGSYQYTLTPTGQRSQIIEHTGRVINYIYDDLYRLKEEKISTADNDVVFSYQYDAVGNRVYSIEDGVHTKYAYDTNDRLLKQGGVEYEYDNNGNTLRIKEEKQVVQMSYDGDDRLISVVTEENGQVTSTVSYGYDADGNRVQTSLNGEVTQYVVDSNDSLAQVIAELDKEGQVQVAYLHGDDLISQYRENDIHYYHYDGLGSTRGLTDQNAFVTDAYNYEAFGELLEQIGETENNYLYTGEQIDPNTGNYYLRARYYNPASGRFLSMDSFDGFRQSPITLHKYLYANANPVNMIDPSGQFSLGSLSASISIRGILTGMARFDQLMGVIDFVNDPTAFFYDRLFNRTLRILNRLRFLKWLRLYKKKRAKKDKDEDCPVAGNSFTGETLVHTQRGLITIAEVQIGDQVWSYNEETGEQQWNEVIHLIQGEQEYDLVLLTLENGEIIEATNEHPFFVVEKGWVSAEKLNQGDVLVLKEGNIEVVGLVREQRKTAVYNLTVANAHNYFVGSDGVLVHNASKKGKKDRGQKDVCIALDGTGKVHGDIEYFPKPKDFDRYSREELELLLDELKESLKTRIKVTVDKGREMKHGQRQGDEQQLIKQLEKYLSK